jgi:hypothetical protein
MAMRVDISRFLRSWDRISDDVPKAIIAGFAEIADLGRRRVRVRTRSVFKLHSSYILNGIRSIPGVRGSKGAERQAEAALRGLTGKYHDFQAAVFLRGSNSPKKSLGFMADHEFGRKRKPHKGRALALPRTGVTIKAFRTSKGRVKRRYKPETVIKKIKAQATNTRKRRWGRYRKPRPFLVTFKSGRRAIAVRKDKTKRAFVRESGDTGALLLYEFQKDADIKKRYGFEETVHETTKRNIKLIIAELAKVK